MAALIVVGLVIGSVYGMAGTGLVLTYKTSGILNFGYGALATVGAYGFYMFQVSVGLPTYLALFLAVVVLGVAIGFGMERLARSLTTAPLPLRVGATVGIILIVESSAELAYGVGGLTLPSYLPSQTFNVFGVNVGVGQVIVCGLSFVAVVALMLFFRLSRLGVAMHAVVENSDLLGIEGTNPIRVRRVAWIIGSIFATLSGVLLAPMVGLDASILTALVLQAFGAAAIGGFSSLPLTYGGGLVLGVASSVLTKYITGSGTVLSGLPASLPFLVLFVVLIVTPRRRLLARIATVPKTLSPWSTPASIQIIGGVVVLGVLLLVPHFAPLKLAGWTITLTYVIIFLALGLLVRTAGQVSLCTMAFAAIGAVAYSKLTVNAHLPWYVALLLAGLVAVPVGALLAIPAVRLAGIYLAVATFGFGLLLQSMFYSTNLMFGQSAVGLVEPPPSASSNGLYYVVLAVTVVCVGLIVLIVKTRMGRLLRGLGEARTALSASGTSTVTTLVVVFSISAFFVAVGGALGGTPFNLATDATYDPVLSLSFLAVIVIVAGGAPWYALAAAFGLGVIPLYVTNGNTALYLQVLFGVSIIAMALLPPSSGGAPLGVRRVLEAVDAKIMSGIRRLFGRPVQVAPDTAHLTSGSSRLPVQVAQGIRKSVSGDPVTPLMRVEDLKVAFGGLVAVKDLSFEAPGGAVIGLIGPNGAGKTTALNVCSGFLRPTSGRIFWEGQDITKKSPDQRARLGIGRTFQQMELYESLTVEENIRLGMEAAMAGSRVATQLVTRRGEGASVKQAADEALEICNLQQFRARQVAGLSSGQRRLVELGRCLAGSYSLLLLDEPSSGLDRNERDEFSAILRNVVVEERGIGIVLVEHDMRLVMGICDRLYVLDYGELIFEGSAGEAQTSETVRAAYLGTTGTEHAEDMVSNVSE